MLETRVPNTIDLEKWHNIEFSFEYKTIYLSIARLECVDGE